jgi:hypothetical protein
MGGQRNFRLVKFSVFHGTWNLVAVFTRSRHKYLFWTKLIRFHALKSYLFKINSDIDTCIGCAWRVLEWWLDSLHLIHSHNPGLQAIAIVHTLQFTVQLALALSVFVSRIQATDLQPSHCDFKSYVEVFFAQPNSFLAIILQLPIPKIRITSIPLLSRSCPGRLTSRNATLHFALCCWNISL